MFKLPTCPHCNTIYRYGDVKKTINEKSHKCYNCKKDFKVSKKGLLVLLLLLIIFEITVNLLELNIFVNINFIALTVTNIVVIIAFLAFIPFFISYKKDKK